MIWPLARKSGRDTQTGVALDGQLGGSVAVIQRQGTRLRLRHLARCAAPADGDWRSGLASLLGEHKHCVNAVADDNSYQLLLVDRPDVPDAELAAAVRWRVREMIGFPVEQSVVDVFDVPSQARGSRRMVYAVVSRIADVTKLAGSIVGCGARLRCIDIVELCMRNLAVSLEQDRFGVAFLLVRGHQGVLTVTRDKKLYLIRQMEIPVGSSAADDSQAVSAIALELQRSLDYFESHYDQRPIRDVVLAPSADGARLCDALGRELAVNVSLLDFNELLESSRSLNLEEQSSGLLAIGAALRADELQAAAA